MTFRLTRSIPYEGDHSEDFETLDEVKARIKEYQNSYSLDDIDVVELARHVDVYELMKKE